MAIRLEHQIEGRSLTPYVDVGSYYYHGFPSGNINQVMRNFRYDLKRLADDYRQQLNEKQVHTALESVLILKNEHSAHVATAPTHHADTLDADGDREYAITAEDFGKFSPVSLTLLLLNPSTLTPELTMEINRLGYTLKTQEQLPFLQPSG